MSLNMKLAGNTARGRQRQAKSGPEPGALGNFSLSGWACVDNVSAMASDPAGSAVVACGDVAMGQQGRVSWTARAPFMPESGPPTSGPHYQKTPLSAQSDPAWQGMIEELRNAGSRQQ